MKVIFTISYKYTKRSPNREEAYLVKHQRRWAF